MTILLRQKPLPQVVRQIVQRDNGAWFDPSDLSTLFQDAAGTIPVTAVEQPVGLVLDKSQGLMLGPELVSNGTFDADTTGWTTSSANISIDASRLKITSAQAPSYISTPLVMSAGSTYVVSCTAQISETAAAIDAIRLNASWLSIAPNITPVSGLATISVYFRPSASTTSLDIIVYGAADTIAYIDNISVRELYGYHATQSVTASRPVLSARKNLLVATETLSTQSVTTLAAKYCLSFWGTGSITLSGTATGVLQGTGAGNRVWVEFTPTAGTLTLTVSGTVSKAQLELTS